MEERKKASDYPQELLNLFDKYVHGEIERRDFLDDLGEPASQLCMGRTGTERRRAPEDRVRHGSLPSG